MRGNARTFALLVTLESGLGFLAILVTWLSGISLQPRLELTSTALLRGGGACLPMVAAIVLIIYSQWSPMADLVRLGQQMVRELFAESSWGELALISLAAGLGEELLFRGALQPWIAAHAGTVVAVLLTSLLFGLAHAMSTAYFVAATIIGIYLGWLTEAYDDLVAPIVAHAVYDFIAILLLRRGAELE